MRERHPRTSILLPAVLSIAVAASVIVIAEGAFAPREAHASVAVAVSLDDLARASGVIARVTALERESRWEDGRIVTYSRARVDDVIAGAMPGGAREVRIRTLGGRVGDIGQTVEGEAMLAPSETSIVFLASRSAARITDLVVVGRAQGQLLVRRDVHGREVVRLGTLGELVARPVRPPLRPNGRPVTELDGAAVATVVVDVKRAWEVSHAR
jgi:hypothetical protein